MNDSNDISLADALSGCAYSVRKSDLEKSRAAHGCSLP